jgi:hypothetical protein
VVTIAHGPWAGQRVVRGREDECRSLFQQRARSSPPQSDAEQRL